MIVRQASPLLIISSVLHIDQRKNQKQRNKVYQVLQAILMSQARAISKPPPKATPSIAAIVGTGRLPVKQKTTWSKLRQIKYITYTWSQLHLLIYK